MDKYEIIKQIGDGSYGTVAKAVHKKTNQLVAIKRMKQKYYTWDECIRLAEVQVLRKMNTHPNVVKLKEVLRENNELFFVFEFMDGDMLGVIRQAKQHPPTNPASPFISHAKVRAYMYQIFQSLVHLHKSGYFHRDMKPENLLIKKDPSNSAMHEIVKLADFGLVKETRARPPFTDYVSTRWYRGPELLLQDRAYGPPVDVWAAGCIMCELISTRPLFPGSNELDQLFRIICVLGAPTEKTWPEGCAMARKLRYTFPNPAQTPLKKMLPAHCPPVAFDFIEKLLVYDPKKRLTATQALQHPYFTATGGGLGDPTFDQPLSTVGIPRPTQTNSAPASQQLPASNAPSLNGTGAFNKPATADRPVIEPISISKPPGGGANSPSTFSTYSHPVNSNIGNMGGAESMNSTFNGTGGSSSMPSIVPAYKRYSQDLLAQQQQQGKYVGSGQPSVVPAYKAYASPTTNNAKTSTSSSTTRPPVKVPSVANTTAKRNTPTTELDDLLDEFTHDIVSGSSNVGTNSSAMKNNKSTAAFNSGLNLNLGASPPIGQFSNTTTTSGVSPLTKLLNSARYRNGGNVNAGGVTSNTVTSSGPSSILKPPETFVGRRQNVGTGITSPKPVAQAMATTRPQKVNSSFDIDDELAWLDEGKK